MKFGNPDANSPSANTNIDLGAHAELQAEYFLQQQGLKTYLRNYRSKQGEIDLIMMDQNSLGKVLVFVEVRLRTNKRFAPALETVDYRKQRKIIKTAMRFLQEQKLYDKIACRFDVIAFDQTGIAPPVQWVKNAFSA